MSGLMKRVVGTLGILLVVVGQSYAQNVPTQSGGEAVSQPNHATDSQVNAPQNLPAASNTQTQNPTQTDATSVPANNTVGAPAAGSTNINSEPSSASAPSSNQAIQEPVSQNSASQNSLAPLNNDAQRNDAQALPPINRPQNNNANQGLDNPSPQPLPPINAGTNDGQQQGGQSDLNIAPSGHEANVGVDKSMLPHDLSPYGMFMQADWVVKTVMIGLALASLLTWIIFVAKTIELSIAKAKVRSAVGELVSAKTLSEAIEKFSNKKNVSGRLVNAAASEVRMSINAVDGAGSSGLKERVTSALSRIEAHAGRRMAGGSAILATIGSISPFVGLFGTVWGIMNAFIGISKSQVTNLAVVAPGIAEALLATAIGLVAAIPAVVIYNYLAKSITGYRQIVTDASTSVERLVSRDLDFREAQRKSPRPAQSLAAE